MSLIQMVDGKQFIVSESVEEIIQGFDSLSPQGRMAHPRFAPQSPAARFARFTREDETPVYVNLEHVAFVTEEE